MIPLLRLAVPIWLTLLLGMSWGLLDTLMLARLAGVDDLAALAIGGSFYMAINIAGKGCLQALAPLAAREYGAQRVDEIGQLTRQALWLAGGLACVGGAILLSAGLLSLPSLSPEVHDKARLYLALMACGLFGSLGLRVVSALTQAIEIPLVLTWLMAAGLVLKLPLNWLLIVGKPEWGIPPLGVAGCAAASALVNTVLLGAALVWVARDRRFAPFRIYRGFWPHAPTMRRLLAFGVPFGLGYWLEAGVFTAIAVTVSTLGTQALAASQIVASYVNALVTVPVALSLAVAVQVSSALGAAQHHAARRAGRRTLLLAAVMAVAMAASVWGWPDLMLGVYRPAPDIQRLIVPMLGLLVLYHVADAVQSVASFLNRAHGNAWWPALTYAVCLWGIAVPLGYVVAAPADYGSMGLALAGMGFVGVGGVFAAQALGLALAAMSMGGWWYWRHAPEAVRRRTARHDAA